MSNKGIIYRQDAIDALYHVDEYNSRSIEAIKQLPSAESEINKQELIRTMNAGIIATNTEDVYSCGMRNGIRWCRALLEDDPPKFENASQYAEPDRKTGEWIYKHCVWFCSECGENPTKGMGYVQGHDELYDFCPNCGSYNGGEQDDSV